MTHFGALIGALFGFLAAQFPEFIEMMRDRFTHQRELESKQQEMDAAAQGYQYTIHEQGEQLASQASQIDSLQRQAEDAAGDIDFKEHIALQFLRSSVRPIITYGFFALFAIIALFSLHHGLIVEHTPVKDIFPIIWDGDTEDLFAAVIAFWFGSRTSPSRERRAAMDARDSGKPISTLSGTGRITGE
jgi:hypothetical protein